MIAGTPTRITLAAFLNETPVLSETFSGLNQLLYRTAGGAWTAALGTISEAGGAGSGKGYYDYLPTTGEVVVPWFEIRISGVCDEFVWREDVEATDVGSDVTSVVTAVTEILTDTTLIRKAAYGRWKIFNNQLVIYDDNNVTPLATFELKDLAGNPTETAIFERVPA